MKLCLDSPVHEAAVLEPGNPQNPALQQDSKCQMAAVPVERIHSLLRRMSDEDWAKLKALLHESLSHPTKDEDIDVLERLFRRGEVLARQFGGTVLQMIQAITDHPTLLAELKQANDRLRARVRFLLREMSDEDWQAFKASLEEVLSQPTKQDDIAVLELVFRIGESVSNIEIAALARADQFSNRKRLQPEVARRNALMKVWPDRAARLDPEAAYREAKQALEEVEALTERAQNTLAYRNVKATAPYKHARSTVFKTIDAIAESPALMAEAARIERELLAVGPVSREQMRWALHRMPIAARMNVLKLIPLNTILMFQAGEVRARSPALACKATRDRRLAYDLFVRDQGEEELAAAYELSVNAVKSTVGVILESLVARSLARRWVKEYLDRAEWVEPMSVDEARRRMKRLTPDQRGEILNRIPTCAWKARSEIIRLHKRLFLDYLTGEWVVGALVDYYNLDRSMRLTGTFHCDGTLTARGTQSAIVGILHKISKEPDLRQCLRKLTCTAPAETQTTAEALVESEELTVEQLMPPAPNPGAEQRADISFNLEPLKTSDVWEQRAQSEGLRPLDP